MMKQTTSKKYDPINKYAKTRTETLALQNFSEQWIEFIPSMKWMFQTLKRFPLAIAVDRKGTISSTGTRSSALKQNETIISYREKFESTICIKKYIASLEL